MHPHELLADPAAPAPMPWSPEAETHVLAALMFDPQAWDSVGDILTAGQFFSSANKAIFTAIGTLAVANKPVDIVTVHDLLQSGSRHAGDVDLVMLNGIAQSVASSHAVRSYAQIIAEKAQMRELLIAVEDTRVIAVTPGMPAHGRLDAVQARLQALQFNGTRRMPEGVEHLVVDFLDRVSALHDGSVVAGIPTGFPRLDGMLGGGLKPGNQVVIAARPSVGKSSIGQQLVINVASSGHPAAMFSQEMPKSELTDRAVANLGRIALDRITTGKLEQADWSRLTDAVEQLGALPLFFDDQPALTFSDIAAKARMLQRQHGVKVIVIDYLQLCASGRPTESRHHQIEELSRGLKNLARDLGITIVLLSQLNREVEKRASGRAVLSDLKESGAIEEDADVVILLNNIGDPRPDGSRLIACDVPKNRQGRTGELALRFDGAFQRWEESTESVAFKAPPKKKYTEDM